MIDRDLQLLLADRQVGKTTQAIAWLSRGVRVEGYPGWSRVLVVSHEQHYLSLSREWWARLEDFGHRVYTLSDWFGARAVRRDTEVCVDDLEEAIRRIAVGQLPGRLVAATITARSWEPVTFRESAPRAFRVGLPPGPPNPPRANEWIVG